MFGYKEFDYITHIEKLDPYANYVEYTTNRDYNHSLKKLVQDIVDGQKYMRVEEPITDEQNKVLTEMIKRVFDPRGWFV